MAPRVSLTLWTAHGVPLTLWTTHGVAETPWMADELAATPWTAHGVAVTPRMADRLAVTPLTHRVPRTTSFETSGAPSRTLGRLSWTHWPVSSLFLLGVNQRRGSLAVKSQGFMFCRVQK
uniref:Putative secreted protein n=1 Tax=Ixodes ricinus TaxID=34613 RepID=A0A6B0UN73_IXORI